MNAAQIAQLAIILAPIVKDIVVEGSKIIATFREDISQADLDKALELSKSSTWPELGFGVENNG
jgi:hypothetical protein